MMHYKVPGSERKKLAKAMAIWLEEDVFYKGAPSFAYTVGDYTLDKDGNLIPGSDADKETTERLVEHLYDLGFETISEAKYKDTVCLAVSIPTESLSQQARVNLTAVLKAKGSLIKKALGTNDLPILYGQGEVSFPWFNESAAADESHAYVEFVSKLCEYARKQKRVNATEKAVKNEKYAFRCFLLRLGFIGKEYKTDRKILLRNLIGSAAFKTGKKETA